jgi:predicted esterase
MKRRNHPVVVSLFVLLLLLVWQAGPPTWSAAAPPGVPIHILGSDGFVRDWLILGQFPNPKEKLAAPDGGYATDYLTSLGGEAKAQLRPETRIALPEPSGGMAQTRRAQTAPTGIFHFESVFGKTDYQVAYAFCYVRSDKDQKVTGYFGSNDDAKIWINGTLVHQFPEGRSCTPRQDTFTVQLNEGLNPLLVKICERWGDWAFVLELFTDEFLMRSRQRPLARALGEVRTLDLCLRGLPGNEFPLAAQGFPPVQWDNPYRVRRLLGEFPLQVAWFDVQGTNVTAPKKAGWYTAVAEGTTPDGIHVRRAKRFYGKVEGQSQVPLPPATAGRPSRLSEEPLTEWVAQGPEGSMAVSYVTPGYTAAPEPTARPGKQAQCFDRFVSRGESCLYWLYLPEGYGQKDRKWPLILVLHGSFQQGRDLSRIGTPIPPNVEEIRKDFPFVVVTPQCPDEYDAWPSELLVDLIDEMVLKYHVDARRVAVTGVSLGGRGSWSVAVDYPERFAAVVPVCGTYDHPERIGRLKNTPVWAFHGDQDTTVAFGPVKKMVESLQAQGGNVKFTIYPGAGHGISGMAYRTKELYDWLLQQARE